MGLSYTLRVTYQHHDHAQVWREIELLGVQTLHDLHAVIQQAFEIGGESNNFAFYLSGRFGDEASEYSVGHRSANRGVSTTHLLNLALHLHQHFLYFFDYKPGLHFTIEVIEIDPHAPDGHYPKILKSHGHLNLHAIARAGEGWQHEIDRGDEVEELEIENVEPEGEDAGEDDDGGDEEEEEESEEAEESEQEDEEEEELEEDDEESEDDEEAESGDEAEEENEESEANEEVEVGGEGEEQEKAEEEEGKEPEEVKEEEEPEKEEPEDEPEEDEEPKEEEKEEGEEPEEEHEVEEEPEGEEHEAHEEAKPEVEAESHEAANDSGEQPIESEAEPAPSGESTENVIGGEDVSNASGESEEESESEG